MGETTIQQQLKATLEKSGLPYKRIDCYGSQIVVTAWSEEAGRKWASLLAKFATFRGMTHSIEKTKDTTDFYKANPGLVMANVNHDVWNVFARI